MKNRKLNLLLFFFSMSMLCVCIFYISRKEFVLYQLLKMSPPNSTTSEKLLPHVSEEVKLLQVEMKNGDIETPETQKIRKTAVTNKMPPPSSTTSEKNLARGPEMVKLLQAKMTKDDIETETQRRLKAVTNKKFILIWYKIGMSGPVGLLNRETCGYCETTRNRSLLHDNATDAVVFYYKEISPSTMPPTSERNPDQLHIFWNKEPTPLMRYVHHKELDFEEKYGFNATMTYRRDSDFFNSYRYHWIRASLRSGLTLQDILKIKNGTGIAIVSDCDWTAGAKLRYKILRKIKSMGFALDAFGKCFPESEQIARGDKETVNKIRKYKFFFSFENSYHCTDYITEKLYRNGLFAGAVPVVLGPKKEDYEAIVPPGSCIYVDDFSSLSELIDYLRYLDNNDTAYLEYFKWRQMTEEKASPYNERQSTLCHICRALHGINVDDAYNPKYDPSRVPLFTEGVAQRRVPSLKKFLFQDEDTLCMVNNVTLLPLYQKYDLGNV